jgi:hypothetical protein
VSCGGVLRPGDAEAYIVRVALPGGGWAFAVSVDDGPYSPAGDTVAATPGELWAALYSFVSPDGQAPVPA